MSFIARKKAHFPHLTDNILEFATKLRTPQNRPKGVSREEYMDHMTKVVMAMYGSSHIKNTKVGNDFIRESQEVNVKEILSRKFYYHSPLYSVGITPLEG